jgi:hypothetical protein
MGLMHTALLLTASFSFQPCEVPQTVPWNVFDLPLQHHVFVVQCQNLTHSRYKINFWDFTEVVVLEKVVVKWLFATDWPRVSELKWSCSGRVCERQAFLCRGLPETFLQWGNPQCSMTGRQIRCYIRSYAILEYSWP